MPTSEQPAIELRRLSFRYPNGRLALDAITCAIPHSERIAIVGPSGAGKSTLLMHLNGLLPAPSVSADDQSQVFVQGQAVTRARLHDIRRQVGFAMACRRRRALSREAA